MTPAYVALVILAALLTGTYYLWFWRTGQTLGMRAVGIQVVAEVTGQPLPPERRVFRSHVFWLPNVLGALINVQIFGPAQLIAFVWAAFDPRKQGLHDKLANSLVIMGRRPRGMSKSAVVLVGIGGAVIIYTVFFLAVFA